MHRAILQKVIASDHSYGFFTRTTRMLVAVSGGADSTALLRLLATLKDQGYIKDLLCVHFNHQLRTQADQDQLFVEQLASSRALPFVCETQDVEALAKANELSIETAGRQWRLTRLIDLATKHQCDTIATGHHLNDNVETLIHRLARGTGYRGLCGIRPIRYHQGQRVISPLLCLTRQDILTYLSSQKQRWCEDASNQDQTYTRNYIRQTILPKLANKHPQLLKKLATLSLTCHSLYAQRIEPHVETLLESEANFTQDTASIQLEMLRQEPPLILVEFFRQILTRLDIPLRTVSQYHYQAMLKLLQGRASCVNLPGNTSVTIERGNLIFKQVQVPQNKWLDPVELTLPGSTRFGQLVFQARIMDRSQMDSQQGQNRCLEYFDLETLNLPLFVRQRVPGDQFIPLGKRTPQKVGKFLSRTPLSKTDRDRAAILCDDQGDIHWVCPVRMSEQGKATNKTTDILEISVRIDPKI
jgi:tRNA(Ile)-lysidine synthase